MISAILPVLAVLMLASSASWACGGNTSRPAGMIADEARIKPLVAKLLTGKAAWDAASSERGREISRREVQFQDERTQLIDAFKRDLGPDFHTSDVFQAAIKRFDDTKNKRLYSEPLPALPAVRVQQIRFICDEARLDDGHSIDADSYWILQRGAQAGWDISGVEAHYLIEHSQAQPGLIEKLERLLGADEPPMAPREPSRIQSSRILEKLSRLAAPISWN